MSLPRTILLALAASLSLSAGAEPGTALTLHYDQPAAVWTEALPVGNGRLGAMVFGRPDEELIQLNEATLWSGGPVGANINPGAYDALGKVREALAREDYAQAYALSRQMQGRYTESFQPLGDLQLRQDLKGGEVGDYRRALDIRDGIQSTSFTVNGVRYRREVFASAPDQLIVVRLGAERPGQISLDLQAASPLRSTSTVAAGMLQLKGKAPAHVDPNYVRHNAEPIVQDDPAGCRGMRFALLVKPVVRDGVVTQEGGRISIRDASEVTLLVSAATSFNGYDRCPDSAGQDEQALALAHLERAAGRDAQALRSAHVADFRRLFDRLSLVINPGAEDRSALPTDRRLREYTAGQADPALEALYVQFGRYLLMSSSRTRGAPANLQGIWNKETRPSWSSNYTTNINVQMNYWPVESANPSFQPETAGGVRTEV